MHSGMAAAAEGDEIGLGVISPVRPMPDVVRLQIPPRAAQLARVAVAGKHAGHDRLASVSFHDALGP